VVIWPSESTGVGGFVQKKFRSSFTGPLMILVGSI